MSWEEYPEKEVKHCCEDRTEMMSIGFGTYCSLYWYNVNHVFIELFKILKERQPISLANMFQPSLRSTSRILLIPLSNHENTKQNFVHRASITWNSLIDKVLDRCDPNSNNIVIPGSSANSDLSTPISVVKNRVKAILHDAQNRVIPGREMKWLPENNWCTSPKNC